MSARFDGRALRRAVIQPPLSKSDAQRALVLAHARARPDLVALGAPLEELPADVRRLSRGLETLRQARPGDRVAIDCGDGGAPFRFLVTQAAITSGVEATLTGTPRLGERPHRALFDALRATLGGAGLEMVEGNPWPLRITGAGRAVTPEFRIDASASSQYASSLLLGCATLSLREQRPWSVVLEGELASAGYLQLTLDWLGRAGYAVRAEAARWTVSPGSAPTAPLRVPGDWSSLGYLLCLAWRSGAQVARVDLQADHPDREILRALQEVGLSVASDASGLVSVSGVPRGGVTGDGEKSPDLLPTLAALACALPTASTLSHVEILRDKESDRLEGIVSMVQSAGGQVRHESDTLQIWPVATPRPFQIDTRHDHRMAMSAATLAALLGTTVELSDATCVEKSFPDFWQQVGKLGGVLTEV